MAAKIDEQVKKLTDISYETATKMLTRLKKELDIIANELLRKETIEADDFVKLLGPKKSLTPAKT